MVIPLTADVINDLSAAKAARVVSAKQISLPQAQRGEFLTKLAAKFPSAQADNEKPGMVALITSPELAGSNVSIYAATATLTNGFLELAEGYPLIKSW